MPFTMYLNNYDSRNALLTKWMFEALPHEGSVLDVGANDGSYSPEVAKIADHFHDLRGVDPDSAKLSRNPFVSTRYFSTLEKAEIPPESFDALYSFYVLEHVQDDEAFIAAAASALKPGGSFFFITPNGQHYFAFLSALFESMGLQRRVLGMLRSAELVESYHYPAVYKLNSPRNVERIGKRYGFERFEYRYCEHFDEIAPYFPGVTKVFPRLWEFAANACGRDRMLLNFMGRMIKAAPGMIN